MKFLSHFFAPAAYASGTLTESGTFADTETVVIGPKTYTMQAVLTNVDGNVLIGADTTAAMLNLKKAINLESGAGTNYAAAMTVHPLVIAVSSSATTLVVRSKFNGTIGNQIATTETGGSTSWGAATLTGGSGDFYALLRAAITPHRGISAGVRQTILDLIDAEGDE